MANHTASIDWPVRDGSRVPFEVFTRRDIFDLEQERIFRGPVWNYVALEAELPRPGDFKTSFVGDTPIVVSRADDGTLHAFVNRCAHRGATVQRQASGNTREHRCVYHQWCYDSAGNLTSVPYRRATPGVGGYPPEFDLKQHGLRKLAVASCHGVIFATFDPAAPSLEEFLDEPMLAAIDRLFSRPTKIIGHMRQRIRGNWKLYAENTRDPYHAGLLHGFHATFGTWRSNQKGFHVHDRARAHASGSRYGDEFHRLDTAAGVGQDNYIANYSLSDPSLMAGRPDFGDNINLQITSIFPALVIQQIMNTLATRHIRPTAPDEFELYWTYFGYQDDDEEKTAARLKQVNLVGPAGLISMEDGEAVELIQRAIVRDGRDCAFLEFGRLDPDPEHDRQGEHNLRGFWRYYARMMA
jgi:anthranilate 1,2-dioxygenase large subunit